MNQPILNDILLSPGRAMTPQTFTDVAEERLHRKKMLTAAFRLFGKLGFDEGAAGHITARDPEFLDHFWVNPCRDSFKKMKMSELLLVNSQGDIVEGNGALNGAAFTIHSKIHEARPDIVAAAHAHSLYGKTWSSLNRKIDPITQDACIFYNDHSVFDDYTGPVLDDNEAIRIGVTLADNKACILKNHGLLTVGKTVESAAWWFITMERSCQAQLLAEAVGTPELIRPEIAQITRDTLGVEDVGWFSFQPLYDVIVDEQADMFD